MDLIYIPTAAIYLIVQEKSRNLTTLTSSCNKGKGTSYIWMGQLVLLDTPAHGVIATPNDHNIRTIPHLRVGDRIKAEGLMAVRCGIESDKRGKPQATMWLTLKIREEWIFLGNPTEDSESSDESEESDDGRNTDSDRSRSAGSNADESSCDNESTGISDGGIKDFNTKEIAEKKPTSKTGTTKSHRARGYSGPARRAKGEGEAKTGDKRDRAEVSRGTKDKKEASESESTIVPYKRARPRISVGCADAVSVSSRGDVFDYLAKDRESHQKKVDATEGTSAVPSRTKRELKKRFSNKDELDDREDPVDENEDPLDKGENEDEGEDSSESDEDDAPPKQTKPTAGATAMPTAKVIAAAATSPSSGVDTNATAKVETGKTKTTTTIVTNTVLTTATTPSVHAVTAAAAMAMSTLVTKTMATIRKHHMNMAPSKLKK